MTTQRIDLYRADPAAVGSVNTIHIVSQSVTGPPGADGAGVSVALKESGSTKVAVATVIDFDAGFGVTTGGVVSLDAASDTASGIVELATSAETVTGTDTARAITPAGGAAAFVAKSLYDANTILAATTDNTPVALTVGASTIVGRKASGDIVALTGAEAATIVGLPTQAEFMTIAVGDETTAITTGTAKVTWRMPFAFTLTAVRASLTTASSSGTPTVDINEGGTSVLSTKLTIDANELTSTTAATAAVISDAAIADDALMTIDVDTAGTGAAGLKVTLLGNRA